MKNPQRRKFSHIFHGFCSVSIKFGGIRLQFKQEFFLLLFDYVSADNGFLCFSAEIQSKYYVYAKIYGNQEKNMKKGNLKFQGLYCCLNL
jgi:hypothetical protein